MDFKKRIKTRLYLAVSYIVIGVIMIVLSCFNTNDFLSSLGLVFAVMGAARVKQYGRIKKNEERLKKLEIAETDELNIKIWTEARSLTFSFYIILSSIAVIILEFLNLDKYSNAIAFSLFSFTAIYWICYYFTKKKYK